MEMGSHYNRSLKMDTTERTNTMDETERYDERFTFDTFPTLQELASYRVVFAIWYNYLEANPNITNYIFEVQHKFNKLAESLKIPQVIKNQLENNLSKVCGELDKWTDSLNIGSRFGNERTSRIRCLDPRNCDWLPNGKFDYQKNIPKILTECELSETEKFTILCEYCFEDEIKKFPLESLPSDLIESADTNRNHLIYYWIRYLRNELDEIPLQSYPTVDYLMAAKCTQRQWLAFEYFWNRLTVADQIALAAFKLNTKNPSGFRSTTSTYQLQNRLLSMLSWYQQRCLLSQVSDDIILNFWLHLKSPQSALWAWKHSKDVMTGDQFGKVIVDVFEDFIFSIEERTKRLSMLIEIWDMAPDHLKIYAAEHIQDKIAERFRVICNGYLPLEKYKFLYKMLLVKDVDGRRNFMLKNAISLGAYAYDPRVMNDILDLCLPNPDDRLKYKETILHSLDFKEEVNRGFRYYKNKSNDNTDLRIEFYTANEQQAREFKRNFLVSFDKLEREYFIFDPAEWKILSEYIDKTFPDPAEALKLKKDFIMAFAQYSGDYWNPEDEFSEAFSREDLHYWNDVDSFDEFTLFAEKMFEGDELKTLKSTFLSSFQRVITVNGYYWAFYDENYYRKFLMWCLDYDEQAFTQFKKNHVRAKLIFDGIMNTLNREYNALDYKNNLTCEFDPDLLTKLDDLLIWYLDGDVKKRTEYKKKRILNFNKRKWGIKVVESMHDYGCEDDMAVFLKWAFEDDTQAIRKFKKDHDIFVDSDENDTDEDSDENVEIDDEVLMRRLIMEMRKYW